MMDDLSLARHARRLAETGAALKIAGRRCAIAPSTEAADSMLINAQAMYDVLQAYFVHVAGKSQEVADV